MFSFIKKTLTKIYDTVTSRLGSLFSKNKIDADTLKELEVILLAADTGVTTTKKIISRLQTQYERGEIQEGESLKAALHTILIDILEKPKAAV